MGKKVKKRVARNAQKEKRFPTSSSIIVPQEIVPATDIVVNGASVVKETKQCPHFDNGIDLEKFSLKISSLESLKCDDCREGVADRRKHKGTSKHGKNKGSSSIWVCLECGHFSCGGVGFPNTPQSHAARHAKQYHHPLVLQFANPNLRWCFTCSTLIPVQSTDKNGEQKDVLSEFIKVLKTRSSSESRVDVGDIWFGNSSVISGVKSVNTLQSCVENISGGYIVRGLVNLGNTCFFNSVLQNLLAMDKLQDYFLKLEGSVGPLTMSLKKLFVETSQSMGSRNVINPRSFLGCVCAKAPQFKGFQQHDSHELLRCLLDGLCTEESRIQKRSQGGNNSPKHAPPFVDTIFGGQISSTVSCLECGHASVVYEPYLDLSLPLPTKRSPSKMSPLVSRSKKPKLPPKRQGKFRSKTKKPSDSSLAHNATKIPNSDELSSGPTKSIESCADINDASLFDSTLSGAVVLDDISDENDSPLQNGIKQNRDSTVISSDNLVQSDCVEPVTLSDNLDKDTVSSSNASSLDHNDPAMTSNGHDTSSEQVDSIDSAEASWLDYVEPSTSTVQDTGSHNQDSSVIHDSGNSNDVIWEDEPLLKVQESEVLLLPCKEIGLTSEQEPSDFDGFGGLFDEPEPVAGPSVDSSLNGVERSESDPDEVDDTESPVSVEKCLAYFTTAELLTKTEHAWQCEQCSKSLLEQKMRIKNKLQNPIQNGDNNGISSASSVSGTEHLLSNGFRNHDDRSTESAVLGGPDENLTLHNGNSESCQDTESGSNNGPSDKCKNGNIEQRESQQHESDSSDDDEVDSKGLKVVRDASKRILISRAPQVLTIHLKRFCQDVRGRLSKLNGHVKFRDTVDLKPYMDPSCCKDRETYKYRLVGVVEHLGSMRGGHYVAYVKGGAKGSTGIEENDNCMWYHASDAYVREVSLEEVLRCEAYILFYEET